MTTEDTATRCSSNSTRPCRLGRWSALGPMMVVSGLFASCTANVGAGDTPAQPAGTGGIAGSGSVGRGGGAAPLPTGSGGQNGGGPVGAAGGAIGPAGTGAGNGVGSGGTGGMAVPGTTAVMLEPLPLRRLTNFEYDNTIRDLFKMTGSPSVELDFPADDGHAGFRSGRSISETHVDRFVLAAERLAAQVTANLKAHLPCDPVTAGESACAAQFIRQFGARVFRRAVDAEQAAALERLYASVRLKYDFATGIGATVEAMLQSPLFLYHLEPEEWSQTPGAVVSLTGPSMANRLSYLLWGTMPDSTLYDLGASPTGLSTVAQRTAQAERLVKDPRARVGMRNFLSQWLDTERIAEVRKDPMEFPTFDGVTAKALQASIETFVDDSVWSPARGLEILVGGQVGGGNVAYVNKAIAPLFGVTSTSEALQKVPVDPAVRRGILTHPGLLSLLATPSYSHPVKRGVYVLEHILCTPFPEPAIAVPPFEAIAPGLSVREQFERTTAPLECQSCHRTINPLGFAFENFDAAGKLRTIDDAGKPVKTGGTVVGTVGADGAVSGAIDLISRLATNPQVSACLTKKFYTYATKHFVNASEAQVLEELQRIYTDSDQDFARLIVATTQSEAFLKRRRAN